MPEASAGARARDRAESHAPDWLDRLIEVLAVLCGVMLCALVLIICVDAVGRTITRIGALGFGFRGYSLPWSLDVSEYMLYAITFCGAPWVLREGGHIAVDLVVQQLPRPVQRRMATVTAAIGIVVCLVLFYYACRIWWVSFSEGVLVHETFVFPEWWLLTLAPPVFLMLAAVFVRLLRRPPDELPRPGTL